MKTKRLSLFLALVLILSLVLTAVPVSAKEKSDGEKEAPNPGNAKMVLNETTLSTVVGDTHGLTASFTEQFNGNDAVKWSCSDTSIIQMDIQGHTVIVHGLKPGTVTVKATCIQFPQLNASCEVTVRESQYFDETFENNEQGNEFIDSEDDYSDVTLSIPQLINRHTMGSARNYNAQFSRSVRDSKLVWTSSKPNVIRIGSGDGNIDARLEFLIPGVATVTVKDANHPHISYSIDILVWPDVGYSGPYDSSFSENLWSKYKGVVPNASSSQSTLPKEEVINDKLTLNYSSWDLHTGDAVTLKSSFASGAERSDIVWTSTNPDIVSFLYLDEMTLRIDGLKPGTTVITAACSALKTSASCTVTVLEEDTENNVEEVEEEQPMPTITVVKPSKDGSPVTVPVDNITSGTVAFIVYEDGTEQLLKTCYVDGDDLKVRIDENATLKIVDNKKTFNDLKQGAWYNSAVDFVSARGLMNGTSTTQFSPSVTVNHAMAWTMLANLNDQPISGSSPWYDKSRTWAMENNLTDGSDATGTIQRQELATLLWKQAGSPNSTRGFDGFVDADQIDAENVVAMQWALENGIMAGKTGGKMDPTGSTTRAEIAQMFKNFVSSDAYK